MAVKPTREQVEALAAIAGGDADGPLVMLNLNRYRERAEYADEPPGGGSPDVSGREAYGRYGAVALEVLKRVGGEVMWQAYASLTVIGHDDERWDEVIAVRYPSTRAFLDLALDPELLVAQAHRDAGLDHATLIRCTA